MRLNSLSPAEGSRTARRRVGRGIGSGLGKTCGRGHKGQSSRSGGFTKVGFEGGQMPLQRRLPKRGFRSRTRDRVAEVRLHALALIEGDLVDIDALKVARIIPAGTLEAKVIGTGEVERALTLRGVRVTRGARAAIEAAGGRVED